MAVVHLVLAALCAAGFTHFCAETADLVGELGAAAHERGCAPAGLSAIAVEPDAIGHFGHVALAEARIGAVLAFLGAF